MLTAGRLALAQVGRLCADVPAGRTRLRSLSQPGRSCVMLACLPRGGATRLVCEPRETAVPGV